VNLPGLSRGKSELAVFGFRFSAEMKANTRRPVGRPLFRKDAVEAVSAAPLKLALHGLEYAAEN
jgi:hypothetical protein